MTPQILAEGWALDSFNSALLSSGSKLLVALGGLSLVVGLILLMHAFASPYGSPSKGVLLTVMGIMLAGGGLVLPKLSSSGGSGESTAATSSPTPSPSSSSTPSATAGDPIELPKIENLGTLWLIPLVLVIVIVVIAAFLLLKKLVIDARTERLAKAKRIARLDEKWQEIVDRHRSLKKQYLEAETDWDMLFSYPALTDVSVPQTADMIRAMHAADDVDAHRPEDLDESTSIATLAYPKAVSQFQIAWDVALRHAKQVGQDNIPAEERATIKKIRRLLAMAENSGSSQNERETAYGQAYALIKELRSITLPDRALLHIEDAKRLLIEA